MLQSSPRDMYITFFDKELKMDKQISDVSRMYFHHLRNISWIRNFLMDEACKAFLQDFVISRLDYANALLYGVSASLLSRFQRLQHGAAWLMMKARQNDHSDYFEISIGPIEISKRCGDVVNLKFPKADRIVVVVYWHAKHKNIGTNQYMAHTGSF